jgi:steroid 5-alpha reductase family enzyme
MTGSFLALLALGAVLASVGMVYLWAIQVRTRDASHVGAGWATGIAVLAVVYALLADGSTGHRVLAAGLATIWGGRLGLYLLRDRVLGKEEDGRYRALRAKWGARANRNFFLFFQFQALFVVFVSVPYLWSRHPNHFFEWVTGCGVALVATAAPWGWVSWVVPAVLLVLLFRVTGIPATEAQALRSRTDYADYRRTTSVFVPPPPRRRVTS